MQVKYNKLFITGATNNKRQKADPQMLAHSSQTPVQPVFRRKKTGARESDVNSDDEEEVLTDVDG